MVPKPTNPSRAFGDIAIPFSTFVLVLVIVLVIAPTIESLLGLLEREGGKNSILHPRTAIASLDYEYDYEHEHESERIIPAVLFSARDRSRRVA